MKQEIFNIKRYPDKTVLKIGRRKFAEITENKNPEYKFVLWLDGGGALSGFETEDKAIQRAEAMRAEWLETISPLLSRIK